MSAISGIGGASQGLYQFIQSLSGTSPSQGSTATPSNSAPPSSDPTQALQGTHHRHRGHGGGEGLKQIQDAVTSALQNAKSSGSTSNPNTIIEDAIAQVLKGNASATSATSTSSASGSTNVQVAGSDPDGDGSKSSQSTSRTKSTQNAFFQALQSAGVDPKQFRQDFLAAVKDAQGGQVNPATAFQSIPVGSTIDAIG